SKYVESKDSNAVSAPSQSPSGGVTPSSANGVTGQVNNKGMNRLSTYSNPGQNMSQVSPTSSTPAFDPIGRAKSREFLRICLQEISYLTSSVPQSIAVTMPPAPSRLARNEADRRSAAVGARNRRSDFFPANQSAVAPPPLNRANSVPVSTLQSFSAPKPSALTQPLDPADVGIAGAPVEDKIEDATLRQFPSKPRSIVAEGLTNTTIAAKTASKSAPAPLVTPPSNGAKQEQEKAASDESDNVDEEPITVMHSPLSGEQWHAQLQKAGQQLSQQSKSKKTGTKVEDEVQLSKDVQDKFNISSERLNKMVKDWDKSKQDGGVVGQKSIRKKKGKDSAMLDELASLSVTEDDVADVGSKDGEPLSDEPPRWRPKITLRRHMDTVRSIAFHPTNKSILSGSDDGTMKYWNLESSLKEGKRPLNGEVDPIHTYRGHTKAVTAVVISADQNKCFSASLDSTVRSYKLAPMNKETYAPLDPSMTLSTYIGHTDAVWDIRLFPLSISSSQLLGSISADGSLKIWDTETKGSPLKSSWGYNGVESKSATTNALSQLPVPTSLDFCPTDLKKMVVSYTNSVIKLFDIETGKVILTFKSDESYDGTPATQINKVICHPTLPIVVSGHEDRYIRFFDLNS
ncbi:hypothetical protein BX616_005468, partial [Lobosporangium transversale]